MSRKRPDYITDEFVRDLVERSLAEDIGSGDVTSIATVPPDRPARGYFECREDGVFAGQWIAERVMQSVDDSLQVEWHVRDGDRIASQSVLGTVSGPARSILAAERLALNLIQRMSGTASLTRAMVDLAAPHGVRILDTRKTAPGLRPLDKWAVLLGGGHNHRMGLFDMILIKDNHIAAAGGVEPAVRAAGAYRRAARQDIRIELEVRTLAELDAALTIGGIDILLLDNMARKSASGLDTGMLQDAVRRVNGRVETEASGNVTLETVEAIARAGVTYISSGAMTHSVRALDVALNIELST